MNGRRRLAGAIVALIGLITLTTSAEDDGGRVTIRFLGLKSASGMVTLCVHDEKTMAKANLKKKEKALAVVRTNVVARRLPVEWVSPKLPPGEYAILAYHDKNRNGKCDLALFGSERVGASNYDKPLMGYPTFSKARFVLTPQGANVDVRLQKPGVRLLPPY